MIRRVSFVSPKDEEYRNYVTHVRQYYERKRKKKKGVDKSLPEHLREIDRDHNVIAFMFEDILRRWITETYGSRYYKRILRYEHNRQPVFREIDIVCGSDRPVMIGEVKTSLVKNKIVSLSGQLQKQLSLRQTVIEKRYKDIQYRGYVIVVNTQFSRNCQSLQQIYDNNDSHLNMPIYCIRGLDLLDWHNAQMSDGQHDMTYYDINYNMLHMLLQE